VALRLRKLLEAKTGAEVVMTRSDDTFIPLEERTAIANEKAADLFISVHANASRDKRARGIETYYLNFTSSPEALELAARENATTQESVHELQDMIKKIALTEKIEESQDFALQVQREVFTRLRKATGQQKNRGIKKAPFVVLIGAKMPSVLAEISFLTNPQDERLLKKSDHREHMAEALYRGIEQYVNNLGGVKVAAQAERRDSAPDESSAAETRNF
jgi:N-acetylmuramoyl-L-alanine amidase